MDLCIWNCFCSSVRVELRLILVVEYFPVLYIHSVIHYLDTSVAYRRTHLLRRHFNCQ